MMERKHAKPVLVGSKIVRNVPLSINVMLVLSNSIFQKIKLHVKVV
jgi:hypothetical protein